MVWMCGAVGCGAVGAGAGAHWVGRGEEVWLRKAFAGEAVGCGARRDERWAIWARGVGCGAGADKVKV